MSPGVLNRGVAAISLGQVLLMDLGHAGEMLSQRTLHGIGQHRTRVVLLGLRAVLAGVEGIAKTVEQFRLAAGRRRSAGRQSRGCPAGSCGQGRTRPVGGPSRVRRAIASRSHLASSIGRPGEVQWSGAYSRPDMTCQALGIVATRVQYQWLRYGSPFTSRRFTASRCAGVSRAIAAWIFRTFSGDAFSVNAVSGRCFV